MNILEVFEKNQIKQLIKEKVIPEFFPGDTIKIHLKIKEGEKERIQIFEGVCIAKKNSGINSSFTVRKISYGEGVERVFPFYSPQIEKIEVSKSGDVRRSKLYYLRNRSGKSARITEKNKFSQTKPTVDKELNLNKELKKQKIETKVSESDENKQKNSLSNKDSDNQKKS